jgi:Sigma-70, region 4/Anti-sigma-K factor rskA
MTELDRLPPDQRAVLSLVLDRGKSYGEVAEMLAIPESIVRDRAHAALDALANDPARPRTSRPPAPPRTGTEGTRKPPGVSPSSPPPQRGQDARTPPSPASSRRAGALLLGAIVAIVVVAVILLTSGGGGKSSGKTSTAASTKSTTTSSAGKPSLNKTIALTAVEPTLKAAGTAYVLSQGGRRAFYVAARGLPPSSGFFYAVWLYNSPSSSAALGRAPTVSSDGRMEGGGPLPTNASDYAKLIITREQSTHPSHPGPIVLSGSFALH